MAQTPPRSKSIARVAKTALSKDSKLRAKASTTATVDSFVNFAHNLGIGADNPMTSSSYGFNPITRNRTLLEWVHRGSWLGGMAVDVVADDMTRAGIEIKGAISPDDIETLDEAATRLNVWGSLNDTIKWSRLYGGAIGVILIDGQDPETPLRLNTIRKGQFCGILSLDRWMVEPSLSDLVTEYGPNLGLPKFYQVTAQAPALSRMKIHYSRCIRLEGIRLPYWQRVMENLWGISVLERLYDRMIAFDSATTGAAQLVYKSYIRTYKIKDMREVVAAGGDALAGLSSYVDMMRRFQGIEGMTLIDAEDDLSSETHGGFAGLSDALQQFGQQLSGALQIPLVRLFGQSPAGFSTGETDLRNYYDLIRQRQEQDLRVAVTKVYRAIAASEGIELPQGTKIEFRSLWQMSNTDKANVAEVVGRSVAALEESGLIDRAMALKELRQSSHVTGIYSNISDDDISEAENAGPPLPENVEVAEIHAGAQVQSAEVRADQQGATDSLVKRLKAKDTAAKAAGILFVVAGTNKALFIRRGPDGDHPGTWSIPAGHCTSSAEHPEDTARRETDEETGYWYSGPLSLISTEGGFYTYLAVVDKPFQVRLNEESTDYLWTTLDLNAYDVHPGLVKVLT